MVNHPWESISHSSFQIWVGPMIMIPAPTSILRSKRRQ